MCHKKVMHRCTYRAPVFYLQLQEPGGGESRGSNSRLPNAAAATGGRVVVVIDPDIPVTVVRGGSGTGAAASRAGAGTRTASRVVAELDRRMKGSTLLLQ